MSDKKKRKVLASEIHYLDPADCDSTIGYTVVLGRGLSGNISLSDCNRKIEWWFYKETPIRKIDIAIQAMQNFKAAFVKARKGRG